MLKQILGATLLVIATGAWGEAVPRYAVSLEKYTSTSKVNEDATRLRISVATESAQGERSVRVGNVLLCKASDCFRAHTAGYVDVSNTSAGTATTIADVVIPAVTITDVYFMEPGGRTAIAGHLKLDAPLVIEKGFHGLELLIGVRKQQMAGKMTYIPAQTGSSYFNPESQLVHYLPSIETVAKLSLGTVLTIPAGALHKPQVFNIGVDDRGDIYPKIDIYPYLKLSKPIIVETPAIPGGSSTRGEMIVPAYMPEEKHLWAPQNSAVPARNGRVTLNQTGVVEPAALEESAVAPLKTTPDTTMNAPTGLTCAQYLAQPIVLVTIHLASLKTGGVLFKKCENAKPYIHLLYVNTRHKEVKYSIPYKPSSGTRNGPNLMLKRITEFADSSMGLINGFTWDGDYGFSDGTFGQAEGIVRSAGVPLGDNIEGGGVFCKGCVNSGEKFVMAFTRDKTRPVFFTTAMPTDIGNFAMNVASSSTSIIKDGVCNRPGPQTRWSAVGASYGRMIFISSTSSGRTTPEEICAVFKSLGIKNALRLDGGPSAAMVVSGRVLKKLEGFDRVKYGNLRHIAYPLRISTSN